MIANVNTVRNSRVLFVLLLASVFVSTIAVPQDCWDSDDCCADGCCDYHAVAPMVTVAENRVVFLRMSDLAQCPPRMSFSDIFRPPVI